ncbi:esterase lipase [Micractinium conductrix]|uniref:Esterase lipase n=1 Tax=Micractinium conductrix TaxID=554055 RepID=A0A2P6VQ30_9CHLO|nr:esterase lipase [Micractinium conductrix]|eukprot:PSC76180.1 esterase lipase [Micractinium conductrix]
MDQVLTGCSSKPCSGERCAKEPRVASCWIHACLKRSYSVVQQQAFCQQQQNPQMAQREAAAAALAALRQCWTSMKSSSAVSSLQEALWLGTRDGKSRRGKIFKGSHGVTRPRKRPTHPLSQPPQPQQIPIPYPPGWTPLAGSAAAAAGALA